MKKTLWFPREIKPFRSGWYECLGTWAENKKIVMRFFDVEKQQWFWTSKAYGFHEAAFGSNDMWRGLTKEQK